MAGWSELLLGKDNPFSKLANENRYAFGAVGAGLGQGRNFGEGLGLAAQNVYQARPLDIARQEKEKAKSLTQQMLAEKYPDLSQLVESGAISPDAAASEMFKRMSPSYGGTSSSTDDMKEYTFAKKNGYQGSFVDWMATGKNGSAGPQVGLQPQWAIDPETQQYVMGQMGTDGKFHRTDMGGLNPVDPVTMTGGKQGATVDAKTAGAARAALPGAETATKIALDAVQDLRNASDGRAEQFGNIFGIPQQVLPAYPGTEKAKFRVLLEQANGQAFMQARQMLKGGGQITDYEGRRGEAAYSRMQAAADRGDEKSFLEALDDFEAAVVAGFHKLQATAQGGYGASPSPNATAGAADPLGIRGK